MRFATFCLAALASACVVQPTEPYETAYATAPEAPAYPMYPQPAYPSGTYAAAPVPASTMPVSRAALSYEELNQCIALDRSAKFGANEVVAANPELERRRQRIMEDNRRIETQRQTVDSRSRTQVDSFNRDVADLAAFTVDYNQDTGRMQSRADEVNRMVARYNQECAGRPYKRADMRSLTGDPDYRLGSTRG